MNKISCANCGEIFEIVNEKKSIIENLKPLNLHAIIFKEKEREENIILCDFCFNDYLINKLKNLKNLVFEILQNHVRKKKLRLKSFLPGDRIKKDDLINILDKYINIK
ncbi:MAG: hypothetical protein RMJ67_06665 [Elusimicrobiota bacterium]|nr:hypothetical protein [Endomicrobiia bacterium]MDW8166176.1 hypothetical protein [Elusimicrobiota bacterium]